LLHSFGAGIGVSHLKDAFFVPVIPGIIAAPLIVIPEYETNLEQCWYLAHEIGHLACTPGGNRGCLLYDKDEARANIWAAQALIPLERIQNYMNASLDAMIAALSSHYTDLPLRACKLRRLAARIAQFRLESLKQEVA